MQTALIIEQDSVIEEQMKILVNGNHLSVFSEVCPHPVATGQSYPVQLTVVTLSDPHVQVCSEFNESIEHLGGYRYRIRGVFDSGFLTALGVRFDVLDCVDGTIQDGAVVALDADRISADFE